MSMLAGLLWAARPFPELAAAVAIKEQYEASAASCAAASSAVRYFFLWVRGGADVEEAVEVADPEDSCLATCLLLPSAVRKKEGGGGRGRR